MRRLLAATVALQLCGCSLLFVEGPNGTPPTAPAPQNCTTSKIAVGADASVAIVYGAYVGLILLSFASSDVPAQAYLSWAVPTALFGTSAFIGNGRVNQCRKAMGEWWAAHPMAPVAPAPPVTAPPGSSVPTTPPPPAAGGPACFDAVLVDTGAPSTLCYPDLATCGQERALIVQSGQHRDVTECTARANAGP